MNIEIRQRQEVKKELKTNIAKDVVFLKMNEVLFSCLANGEELQREQKGYVAQFLHIDVRREKQA